ncbi:PPOX class F420-dependent oxidoreductase [Nitrospinota bacterium]
MTRDEAIKFIENHKNGVLTTILKDGRPHSAPIVYAASGDTIEISSCWTRVKTKNLQRDPRATLCVLPENGWHPYLSVEGTCELAEDSDGRLNLDLYRRITGGDPDDMDEYLEAMAREKRHLIRLEIERLYPVEK